MNSTGKHWLILILGHHTDWALEKQDDIGSFLIEVNSIEETTDAWITKIEASERLDKDLIKDIKYLLSISSRAKSISEKPNSTKSYKAQLVKEVNKIKDLVPIAKSAALSAFSNIGKVESLRKRNSEKIIDCLTPGNDITVRNKAIATLGVIGLPNDLSIQTFSDYLENETLRVTTLEALRNLGNDLVTENSVRKVVEFLGNANSEVRDEAYLTLSTLFQIRNEPFNNKISNIHYIPQIFISAEKYYQAPEHLAKIRFLAYLVGGGSDDVKFLLANFSHFTDEDKFIVESNQTQKLIDFLRKTENKDHEWQFSDREYMGKIVEMKSLGKSAKNNILTLIRKISLKEKTWLDFILNYKDNIIIGIVCMVIVATLAFIYKKLLYCLLWFFNSRIKFINPFIDRHFEKCIQDINRLSNNQTEYRLKYNRVFMSPDVLINILASRITSDTLWLHVLSEDIDPKYVDNFIYRIINGLDLKNRKILPIYFFKKQNENDLGKAIANRLSEIKNLGKETPHEIFVDRLLSKNKAFVIVDEKKGSDEIFPKDDLSRTKLLMVISRPEDGVNLKFTDTVVLKAKKIRSCNKKRPKRKHKR